MQKKKCYLAIEDNVAHNLIGGAKETFFTLVNKGGATYNSIAGDIDTCFGSGEYGGRCLSESHSQIISKLKTMFDVDVFFSLVTKFTRNVDGLASWYKAGAFQNFDVAKAGSVGTAKFGWGNMFMKQYYIKVTGSEDVAAMIATPKTEGDWAFGMAFWGPNTVGLVKCKAMQVAGAIAFVSDGNGDCVNDTREGLLLVLEDALEDLLGNNF